ncbi:hypothetical protein PNEG_02024 [Pneumocystis murina B123]|uniref:Uncharacterized protein n=1 Tax=Pneumocystis murina (strain B123) TaxID=1069680 RepID=M7NME8_PNEMU|nr:hypothetical protein PNEG_02024 [Pneumocystis murina B123]EMR09843.1 hypothetical protein PNEG_02024 [Pneumocystis murina B123]
MDKKKIYPIALITPPEKNKNIKTSLKDYIPIIMNILGGHELILLEIQGTIERDDTDNTDRHIVPKAIIILYAINMKEQKECIYLKIGYHYLEGKIETLLQPFAVLRRRSKKNIQSNDNESYHDEIIDVLEIIRKRVVFNLLPQPII